jgi:hypothetical protein
MSPHRHTDRRAGEMYRVVVSGRVEEDWTGWFGADRVEPGDEETVLHLCVADPSELLGRIRRLLDLRLRLLSLVLVDPETGDASCESPASHQPTEPDGGLP